MNWTQPLCSECWTTMHPDRTPVRVKMDGWPAEHCCNCNTETHDGIYIRADPRLVKYPTE